MRKAAPSGTFFLLPRRSREFNQRFGLIEKRMGDDPVVPPVVKVAALELWQFGLDDFSPFGQSGACLGMLPQLMLCHRQDEIGMHIQIIVFARVAKNLPHPISRGGEVALPIFGQPLCKRKEKKDQSQVSLSQVSFDRLTRSGEIRTWSHDLP